MRNLSILQQKLSDWKDMSEKIPDRIIARLEALASPVRLAIFRLLVEHEPEGLYSGEIAERVGQAPNGVSFPLKALQQADLVSVHREGRFQRYRAQMPVVRSLVTYLTENCCRATQSCALQRSDETESTPAPCPTPSRS
jgi:ArsR family transcriptional regulator